MLKRCQAAIAAWRAFDFSDFEFSPPKGFSSFTMTVRCLRDAEPRAVLYRQLEGKENAMLDASDERRVYTALADAGVAAPLHAYEATHRIEAFYDGRTLTRHDLRDRAVLADVGAQLARLHAVEIEVPSQPFFERLVARWLPLARRCVDEHRGQFEAAERDMCAEISARLGPELLQLAAPLFPAGRVTFSHNDTYHGNIMLLDDGSIRLLDFEFSCLNHRAFDFSNLFAETVMRHGLPGPPHFDIADAEYDEADVAALVEGYLAAGPHHGGSSAELVAATLRMIPLSDLMYGLAALPLALEPVQRIRFIPYAHRRLLRFLSATQD